MDINKPFVSVVLSVFNDSKNIKSSVKSIIEQTYENLELLLMDDGSNDDTKNICIDLGKQYKNIRTFRNKKNEGLTKSLNSLIKKSKGEFIARQDSDDLSYPERISKQIDFILENKLDGSTTRSINLQTSKKMPKYSFYLPQNQVIKFRNPHIHGTLVIKKEVLESVNFYDEDFYYAQDYMLFAKLLRQDYKIGKLNEVLYKSNTINNISTENIEKQNYFANKVKEYLKNKEKHDS